MSFGKQSFQRCVDGREAAVVSDLKYGVAALRSFENSFRFGDRGREWLFAEDVFTGVDRGERQRNVLRVWSCDVDRVGTFDNFVGRCCDDGVMRARELLRAFGNDIVDRCDSNSLVARQDARMHSGNKARSDDADLDRHEFNNCWVATLASCAS